MSKTAPAHKVTKELQLVFVFTIDAEENPELLAQKLNDLADSIQDSIDVNFDDDANETTYLDQKNLTHLILRHLEDGNEKETVARNYVVTYVSSPVATEV